MLTTILLLVFHPNASFVVFSVWIRPKFRPGACWERCHLGVQLWTPPKFDSSGRSLATGGISRDGRSSLADDSEREAAAGRLEGHMTRRGRADVPDHLTRPFPWKRNGQNKDEVTSSLRMAGGGGLAPPPRPGAVTGG